MLLFCLHLPNLGMSLIINSTHKPAFKQIQFRGITRGAEQNLVLSFKRKHNWRIRNPKVDTNLGTLLTRHAIDIYGQSDGQAQRIPLLRDSVRNCIQYVKKVAQKKLTTRTLLRSVVFLLMIIGLLRPQFARAVQNFPLPGIELGLEYPIIPAIAESGSHVASVAQQFASERALGSFKLLPSRAEAELAFRLVFASFGGALVGLERSSSDHPAGVRTMALVSLGAASFTLCGMYGFNNAIMDANGLISAATKYDPSRMASSVASGVGFIGAGVITNNRQPNGMHDKDSSVNGLTTAAAIWTSAAVGVASGVGLYFISATASLATVFILRFGKVKKALQMWNITASEKDIDIITSKEDINIMQEAGSVSFTSKVLSSSSDSDSKSLAAKIPVDRKDRPSRVKEKEQKKKITQSNEKASLSTNLLPLSQENKKLADPIVEKYLHGESPLWQSTTSPDEIKAIALQKKVNSSNRDDGSNTKSSPSSTDGERLDSDKWQ